jgi:hypothetical protein
MRASVAATISRTLDARVRTVSEISNAVMARRFRKQISPDLGRGEPLGLPLVLQMEVTTIPRRYQSPNYFAQAREIHRKR